MEPKFPLTALVFVKGSWLPGKNSPGGVGTISHVEVVDGEVLYTVKYILGGREKKITENRIRLHDVNKDKATESSQGSSVVPEGVNEEKEEEDKRNAKAAAVVTPVANTNKRARVVVEAVEKYEAVQEPSPAGNPGSKTIAIKDQPSTKKAKVVKDSESEGGEEAGEKKKEIVLPPTEDEEENAFASESEEEEATKKPKVKKTTIPITQTVSPVKNNKKQEQLPPPPPIPSLTATTTTTTSSSSSFVFPKGVAGDLLHYLMDVNRPVNGASIQNHLKQTYTKVQIDKALASLIEKEHCSVLEEGGKLYWISQPLLMEILSEEKPEQDEEKLQQMLELQTKAMEQAQKEVTTLLTFPGDVELTAMIKKENEEILMLENKMKEIETFSEEAKKVGKSGAEVQMETITKNKLKLSFYKKEWRERKKTASEFLLNVIENKGIKTKTALREFYEKVGVELDVGDC